MCGMRDSEPPLERLTPRRRNGLPPVAVAIAVVAIVATSVGFAFGPRNPATSGPNSSPHPALAGAVVSSELHRAYLNVVGSDWAVCNIAAPIACQPVFALPNIELQDFHDLPLTVSANDWGFLDALSLPVGHYALVGRMPLVGPQVAVAKVAPNGAGTLIDTSTQVVLDGTIYVDLGTLTAGRCVATALGYQLQAGNSDQSITATPIGWAVGLVVGEPAAIHLAP
jgi:hypothetical protein